MGAAVRALRIHWARIAWTIAAVASFGAAEAQISTQVQTTASRPSTTWVLPDVEPKAVPTIVPNPSLGLGRPLGQVVALQDEKGGMIDLHRMRFASYQREGVRVEMHGGCWSACTLITGYVPQDKLCFAPGAFLAFHSALTLERPPRANMPATLAMYLTYPKDIRDWIDINGGPTQLTPTGWWVLYDRDLWAMGYPKCSDPNRGRGAKALGVVPGFHQSRDDLQGNEETAIGLLVRLPNRGASGA